MGQYLIHHGVEGQKWGVRHGPPYPLEGENKKSFNDDKKENQDSTYETLDITSPTRENPSPWKTDKRLNDAAELGIMALAKTRPRDFDISNGISDDDKFWFLYEDQTIGMPIFADMVNQGMNKKQIFDYCQKLYDESNTWTDEEFSEKYYTPKYFDILESWDDNMSVDDLSYIDDCIDIKNGTTKLQHSSGGTIMDYYLTHHGVQGMKWGVMHGPPYPLTGENKKAFKADKKALLKADKKRMQLDSNYAKDRYNGSYNKAQSLKSMALNETTKSGQKALLKRSKVYEKDANRALKQLSYGKAKRPGKVLSFIGGGPLGLLFYNLLQKPTDEIYKESIRNPNVNVNREIEAMINEDLLNKSMKNVKQESQLSKDVNRVLTVAKSDQAKKLNA